MTTALLALLGVLIGLAIGWVAAQRLAAARSSATEAGIRAEFEAQLGLVRAEVLTAQGELREARASRDAIAAQQIEAKSIDERLLPIKETVESLRLQTIRASQERAEADMQIRTQIENVQQSYSSLEGATKQLVAAMSSGQSRGQWGEMQLEQLLTHSGLIEGTHFRRQDTRGTDVGASRPDIVIILPGGSEVLVDAKFPFDAYWRAIEAGDSPERAGYMKKHAEDVLARAKELSSKRYSDTSKSPDFVVMFLPLESLLQAALEQNGMLLEETFQKNVILATPTTMLAMLRTIAFGYQRNDLAENAERIQELGAEMLNRLGKLVEHVEKMGRGLKSATTAYNDFVGSFERQAMSQARRMKELGVNSQRALEAPDEIVEMPKEPKPAPSQLEL